MTKRERIREAIRCCRTGSCDQCPRVEDVCDELRVDMVELPEGLVDRIEEELTTRVIVLRPGEMQ